MPGPELQALLAELEAFGRENDAAASERTRRMLNITRDTGEFLAVLIHATRAKQVLEVGTSNGYSTLWLADAARPSGGHVTTIERQADKRAMAAGNFERAGLKPFITQLGDEAGACLAALPAAAFDMIFLDSDRSAYVGWWPDLRRVLRPGGLLVVDNACSHVQEMAAFTGLVAGAPDFVVSTVAVGNGEFLATRLSDPVA